jgi:hypothetical protein
VGVTWQGIGQNVAPSLLEVGKYYNVQVSSKLMDAADGVTETFLLTLQVSYQTRTPSWFSLIYTSDGLTNQWKTFNARFGPFSPDATDTVTSMRVYAEGPGQGYSFAIDDVIITPDLATPSPTNAPTSDPTQQDHLVEASANTELVEIPQPQQANFDSNTARSNCPHDNMFLVEWNEQFPTISEAGNVTLPENTNILITQSITTKLGYITIPPTSTLIIGEDVVSGLITLDVDGIDVQGALIAGSESCRLQTEVVITLHGSRPSSSQSPLYKGIKVTGTLSLHGKRYYRTWTR